MCHYILYILTITFQVQRGWKWASKMNSFLTTGFSFAKNSENKGSILALLQRIKSIAEVSSDVVKHVHSSFLSLVFTSDISISTR